MVSKDARSDSWVFFSMFQLVLITTLTPPGLQGCQEKQNYPLSLNLVVWCAKIEPKTKKV